MTIPTPASASTPTSWPRPCDLEEWPKYSHIYASANGDLIALSTRVGPMCFVVVPMSKKVLSLPIEDIGNHHVGWTELTFFPESESPESVMARLDTIVMEASL